MHDQIVFGSSKEELEEEFGDDIAEFYEFADDDVAARIEVHDSMQILHAINSEYSNYTANERFELRWNLEHTTIDASEWASVENVVSMHEVEPSFGDGSGTTVVVMDSGIDTNHEVFNDHVVDRRDATNSAGSDMVGHGTACAGQIATLAPNVDLVDLRIFGDRGYTTMDVILRAYEYLLQNARRFDVVNMSWGSSNTIDDINRVHSYLMDRGVRDVVAAGNSGGETGSPATTEEAFSVGACNKYGEMADFSSYNPDDGNPDAVAIGVNNVLARASDTSMGTVINNDWVAASGTSFAAPIGSALVAKYFSVTPDASIDDVKDVFKESSTPIRDVDKSGAGILRYRSALNVRDADPEERVAATVWEFAGRDSLYVDSDILPSGKYEVDPEALEDAFTRLE